MGEVNARLQHAVEHDEVVNNVSIQRPSELSVPKKGEIVFNRDITNFKVGDGNTTYGQLNNFIKSIAAASGSDIADVGTPSVTSSTSGNTTTFTFHQLKGATGDTGNPGPQGTGINHIRKTSGSGAAGTTDTYTIYSSVEESASTILGTFNVYNGSDGNGISVKASATDCTEVGDAYIDRDSASQTYGHIMILTSTNPREFTDGGNVQGPQGPQGQQGIQGNTGVGIASIAKTATSGLVDTYTVTYTDSTTTTYTVTNGADGQDGQDGQDGVDGTSATITVGSTTTGAAGTNASVINSGTALAAVLDFTIPRGANGTNGTNGSDGKSVFIAYASDNQGTNFNFEYEGQKYIGFYIGEEVSEEPSEYVWAKFVGEDGQDGIKSYEISQTTNTLSVLLSSISGGINSKKGIVVNIGQITDLFVDNNVGYIALTDYTIFNNLSNGQSFEIIIPQFYNYRTIQNLYFLFLKPSSGNIEIIPVENIDGNMFENGGYRYYQKSARTISDGSNTYFSLKTAITKVTNNTFIIE